MCNPVQPPIVNYVDIPIEHDFPYDFISRDVFRVEYYDGGENFIIYRPVKGVNFFIFDLNLQTFSPGLQQSWELSPVLTEAPKEHIKFRKDTSELEIQTENHMAIQHADGEFAITVFGKDLKLQNVFYINTGVKGATTVRFYKKKLYMLKSDALFVVDFPNGFKSQFKAEKLQFKREYTDLIINRNGVFLFIRGYSELIASEGPNPELSKGTKLFPKTFKHGRFIDSRFGTFILRFNEGLLTQPIYFA